jgi:excinuclease UvrABC nuclease subunit
VRGIDSTPLATGKVKMQAAAEALDFERAINLRDTIRGLEKRAGKVGDYNIN